MGCENVHSVCLLSRRHWSVAQGCCLPSKSDAAVAELLHTAAIRRCPRSTAAAFPPPRILPRILSLSLLIFHHQAVLIYYHISLKLAAKTALPSVSTQRRCSHGAVDVVAAEQPLSWPSPERPSRISPYFLIKTVGLRETI